MFSSESIAGPVGAFSLRELKPSPVCIMSKRPERHLRYLGGLVPFLSPNFAKITLINKRRSRAKMQL